MVMVIYIYIITLTLLMCSTEHAVIGHAGTSLGALQNPFMHTPIAGRVGHRQLDVPSSHKPPKLQVHILSSPCLV